VAADVQQQPLLEQLAGQVCSMPSAAALALLRQLCRLQVMRVLAQAPACDTWPEALCQQALQLLLGAEAVTGIAAVQLNLASLAALDTALVQAEQQEQQAPLPEDDAVRQEAEMQARQQQQAAIQAQHGELTERLVSQMLVLLQRARRLQAALHELAAGGTHASASAAPAAAAVHAGAAGARAQQPGRSGASTSTSTSTSTSESSSQQKQEQQQQVPRLVQQLRQQAADPSWWRSQAVALYRSTRPNGWQWMKANFEDAATDNNKPGFWGAVRGPCSSTVARRLCVPPVRVWLSGCCRALLLLLNPSRCCCD
jgi:hypothetical protein